MVRHNKIEGPGRREGEAGKRLATLAVDTEVRFRSATDRAAFSNELTEAIAKLVSKITTNPPPAAARIASWAWRTLCRKSRTQLPVL